LAVAPLRAFMLWPIAPISGIAALPSNIAPRPRSAATHGESAVAGCLQQQQQQSNEEDEDTCLFGSCGECYKGGTICSVRRQVAAFKTVRPSCQVRAVVAVMQRY
jgi:hypothetical protein